jgi:putative transposase
MKTVCDVLSVARSALAVRNARSPDWQDSRRARQTDDTELVAAIHEHVAGLP